MGIANKLWVGFRRARLVAGDPQSEPPFIDTYYERLQWLGRGGEGDVWLAQDRVLGRLVICKRIALADGRQRATRLSALQSLARDPVAGLPTIYHVIEDGDALWEVHDYIPGETLAAFRPSDEPGDQGLGASQILVVAIDLIEALSGLHNAGWIHGDLSPTNVVVDASGHAHLIDFGLAQRAGDVAPNAGVPGFAVRHKAEVHQASIDDDRFALGALLFWLLSGDTPAQLMDGAGNAIHIAPSMPTTAAGIDEVLWATAAALTDPSPNRRPKLGVLLSTLRRDLGLLPLGARDNLGRRVTRRLAQRGANGDGVAPDAPGKVQEVNGPEKVARSRWLGLWWPAGMAAAVVLVVAGWAIMPVRVQSVPVSIATLEFSPATELDFALDENWLKATTYGVLSRDARLSEFGGTLDLRVLCTDGLCQLIMAHTPEQDDHLHHEVLLSDSPEAVWRSALRDVSRAVVRCVASD